MSWALQPAASVFSKNGERRYHGPKYRVDAAVVGSSDTGLDIARRPPSWVPGWSVKGFLLPLAFHQADQPPSGDPERPRRQPQLHLRRPRRPADDVLARDGRPVGDHLEG